MRLFVLILGLIRIIWFHRSFLIEFMYWNYFIWLFGVRIFNFCGFSSRCLDLRKILLIIFYEGNSSFWIDYFSHWLKVQSNLLFVGKFFMDNFSLYFYLILCMISQILCYHLQKMHDNFMYLFDWIDWEIEILFSKAVLRNFKFLNCPFYDNLL